MRASAENESESIAVKSVTNIQEKIKRNQREIEPTERLDFLTAVAADSRLSKTNAVAVANYLISCRNGKTGLICPGAAKIAKGSGCTKRAAQNAVYKLEQTGWFFVIRQKGEDGNNCSNRYIPNWDRIRENAEEGSASQRMEHSADGARYSTHGDRYCTDGDRGTARAGVGVSPSVRANSVNSNPVNQPSESTQEIASGGGPAVSPKSKAANDNTRVKCWPDDAFDQFWNKFPNKVGKGAARQSFEKIQNAGNVEFKVLMDGLHRYANKKDDRPWCIPTTFLNQERWEDQPAQQVDKSIKARPRMAI